MTLRLEINIKTKACDEVKNVKEEINHNPMIVLLWKPDITQIILYQNK